jgi:DNA-binding CsgD family transcriptional regulator
MGSQVEVLPWTDPEDDVILVRACLALQHSDLADRCVRSARGRRQQNPQEAMAQAILTHIEGLLFGDSAKLNTATAQWRSLGRPILEADAYIALGEVSEREAHRSGLSSFEAAHRILYRAGAVRSAARVRRLLRVSGRSAPRSLGTAPARSDGLTWMEREVVERAVRDHSASQIAADLFLSRHTVVAHLRSIYIKLGITSREELQRWGRTSSSSADTPGTNDLDHLLP